MTFTEAAQCAGSFARVATLTFSKPPGAVGTSPKPMQSQHAASSAQRATIENHLGKAGLLPRFTTYAGRDDVALPKPAPDVYVEAAARIGVPPATCAAVEDSHSGIRSARAARMRVIAIPNPSYPPGADAQVLLEAGAVRTFAHMQQLTKI